MDIRIGTAGYSYAAWKAPPIPGTSSRSRVAASRAALPSRARQEELLAYFARRFRVVEINSSYHGIPKPANVRRMMAQVPDGFEFIFKAHEAMTHRREGDRKAFAEFRKAIERRGMPGRWAASSPSFPLPLGQLDPAEEAAAAPQFAGRGVSPRSSGGR